MPQMKPMNWITLFILTNLILMMFNLMIFFLKSNKNNEMKNKKKNKFIKYDN